MVVLSVMVFQSIQREFRGRSQMEHALQQSQALLQASPDGIHVLDTTGTIVSVNAAFASLLGYHPDYLQGRHLDVITDLALADLAPLEPYAPGAAPRRLLAQYRRYDGSQLTVEVLSTRVAADSGSLIYCSARAIAQNDRGLSSGLLTAYVFNQRDVP
jgi:PAS domain S-box-containing protein